MERERAYCGRGWQSSVGRFRSRRVIRTFRELLKQEPALECLRNAHSTSVPRFDCEPDRYSLSCSGSRRPKLVGPPPCFERLEGVDGEFTHDLRSERRASSGYPLQFHGVPEKKHRSG